MTAIMMASMGAAAVTVAALDTTVTIGDDIYDVTGTDDEWWAFGFNGASPDPLNLSAFGSIGTATYTDGSSTVRTIDSIYYTEPGGSSGDDDNLYFGLIGTSIPDTDATFREIEYNGITYTRASRSSYDPSESAACSFWVWNNISPNGPTFGTANLKVIL